MPSISIGIYVKDEDYSLYTENKDKLVKTAKDSFNKELEKIKESDKNATAKTKRRI